MRLFSFNSRETDDVASEQGVLRLVLRMVATLGLASLSGGVIGSYWAGQVMSAAPDIPAIEQAVVLDAPPAEQPAELALDNPTLAVGVEEEKTSTRVLPGLPHFPVHYALLLMKADQTAEDSAPYAGVPHRLSELGQIVWAARYAEAETRRVLPGAPHRISDLALAVWSAGIESTNQRPAGGEPHRLSDVAQLYWSDTLTSEVWTRPIAGPAHEPAEWALRFLAQQQVEAEEKSDQTAEDSAPYTMPEIALLMAALGATSPRATAELPDLPVVLDEPAALAQTDIVIVHTWRLASLDQPGLTVALLPQVTIAPVPDAKPEAPVFDNAVSHTISEYGPDLLPPDPVIDIPLDYDGAPMIAIMIDDLGLNRRRVEQASALPAPLTMAFIPYGDDVAGLARIAAASGHELFLHLPMEPIDSRHNPGPHALLDELSQAEMTRRLMWNLERFEGYVGVNNHMGSLLTQNRQAMALLMGELERRDLMFVDSVTSASSVALSTARSNGIPAARRDVFLDNVLERAAIDAQLAKLEEVALRQGFAIGIGHPHDVTVAALADWLVGLEDRGFVLVPVSRIVDHNELLLAGASN
tara:strand:+ start:3206 stop:4957 length:1752 start_codon:yes stop_codon:yes gene_type:complete